MPSYRGSMMVLLTAVLGLREVAQHECHAVGAVVEAVGLTSALLEPRIMMPYAASPWSSLRSITTACAPSAMMPIAAPPLT